MDAIENLWDHLPRTAACASRFGKRLSDKSAQAYSARATPVACEAASLPGCPAATPEIATVATGRAGPVARDTVRAMG